MRYGLIIPFYNNFNFTNNCVKSIRKYSQEYQIIFIDNGSDLNTKNKMNELLQIDDILITNAENLGFPKAVNQGLRKINSEYICILNNDIEVYEKWLEILEDYFKQLGGFIGPFGEDISATQIGVNKINQTIPRKVDYLGMACLFSSKQNFDLVGFISEDYGLGFFEDTDYGMRILEKGLSSYLVPVPINHFIGKTRVFLGEKVFASLYEGNRRKFFNTWRKFLEKRNV